jgi:hypothetical protein
MPAFNSEKITIAIATEANICKLFQLGFQKRDGSLFISFPYYRDAHGLLCLATLQAGKQYPDKLDLTEGGKFTSHKVKYSHHPDGNALFSQDGKIYSQVRKKSVPLDSANGHLFTVQIQGLADFDPIAPGEKQPSATARRTRINYVFQGNPPEAVKFVGHCYSESQLTGMIVAHGTEPWISMTRPDRSQVVGAIIRNPYLSSREPCYLLLFCEAISRLDDQEYSALMFMGGFDPREIALNHSRDTSFLALSYPTSSYQHLGKKLGSVDYP